MCSLGLPCLSRWGEAPPTSHWLMSLLPGAEAEQGVISPSVSILPGAEAEQGIILTSSASCGWFVEPYRVGVGEDEGAGHAHLVGRSPSERGERSEDVITLQMFCYCNTH